MSTVYDSAAFERGTEPIFRFFTRDQAESLVAYRGDGRKTVEVLELNSEEQIQLRIVSHD
jgi:hypothetical protein